MRGHSFLVELWFIYLFLRRDLVRMHLKFINPFKNKKSISNSILLLTRNI